MREIFLTGDTLRAIKAAAEKVVEGDQWRCNLCEFRHVRKRVIYHIRQHFTFFYCACGKRSPSKDAIMKHIRSQDGATAHGGANKSLYEVDKETYAEFCQYLGWKNPPTFGTPTPIQENRSPAAERVPIQKRLGEQKESTPPRKKRRMTPEQTSTPPREKKPNRERGTSPAHTNTYWRTALEEESERERIRRRRERLSQLEQYEKDVSRLTREAYELLGKAEDIKAKMRRECQDL